MTTPSEQTPRRLPEVTNEATMSVGRYIGQVGWAGFRAEALATLGRHNPALLRKVEDFRDNTTVAPHPALKDVFTATVLIGHEMLAEQARLDDPESKDRSRYRLPVVQPGVAEALKADAREQGAAQVTHTVADAMVDQNPHLVTSIEGFLTASGADDAAHGAGYAALQLTYTLLDHQATADAMTGQVFGQQPPQEQ